MHDYVLGEGAAVGRCHDAHVRPPVTNLLADGLDHPGSLLTADERGRTRAAWQAIALHHVTPAQAGIFDLDQDLLGTRLRLGRLADPEVLDVAVVVDESRL